jgi:hypothetical protein
VLPCLPGIPQRATGNFITWVGQYKLYIITSNQNSTTCRFGDRDLASRFLGKGVGLGGYKRKDVDALPRPQNPDEYKYNTTPEDDDPTLDDHFGVPDEPLTRGDNDPMEEDAQVKDNDRLRENNDELKGDEEELEEEEEHEEEHFARPPHVESEDEDGLGERVESGGKTAATQEGDELQDGEYDEEEELYQDRYGLL